MTLHLQNKVICSTLTNILFFDVKMIEEKKEDPKIKTLKNGTIANQFR